jgi:pimeloyl-ACP methyl ester carboxylesterase
MHHVATAAAAAPLLPRDEPVPGHPANGPAKGATRRSSSTKEIKDHDTSQPQFAAGAAYKPASLSHGAALVKAELRAASGFLPEVCVVRGQIVSGPTSTINWAGELPDRSSWNGKTLTIGGGGADRFIPTDADFYQKELAGPSAVAFVKISSDSGHQVLSFSPWAVDEIALRNHAYQVNHFALEVGTAITTEFYGSTPTRRYMLGHSNGGRAGLAAAPRFPGDYDGIVAPAPAINQQAHQANVGPTLVRHIYSDPANWLSAARIQLYANAETAACDGLDGLEDGIIGHAAACNYVPNDLLCTGADSDSCLTAGQIETIRLYQPRFTAMSAILDSTDPDLREFVDRGGKLLLWSGIADTCVTAYRAADYFDSVKRVMGESTVSKFARFFVSPGMGHNLHGPGPAKLDWVKALDDWVERSVDPDKLVASTMNAAGTAAETQRPLCPYPQFPRYPGSGDPTQADSFTCAAS